MVAVGLPCAAPNCWGICKPCQCNLDLHFQTVSEISPTPSPNTNCGDCVAKFNNNIYSLAANTTPGYPFPFNLCGAFQRSSRYTGDGTAPSTYCMWSTLISPACRSPGPSPFADTIFPVVFLATYVPTGQKVITLQLYNTQNSFINNFGITSLGAWYSQETVNDVDNQPDSFQCGATYHMIPVTADYQGSLCMPRYCNWSNAVITLTSVAP
jgi:hypothetical protein